MTYQPWMITPRIVASRATDAAWAVPATAGTKLPVCVVVDRSGTRLRRYVVMDLDDFIAWHGVPGGGAK